MQKFISVLLFLTIVLSSTAQNTMIFNYKESSRFSIKNDQQIKDSKSSEYFNLIALKSQKSAQDISTRFEFSYELKLIRDIEKLRIIVEMSSLDLRNDIAIKGFPINKYLHPKKANCKVQWLDDDDNILKEFYFEDAQVDKKWTKLADHTFVDSLRLPKKYKLKLIAVDGYYDETNLEDLRKVTKAIDMYFDADARATMIMNEVKDLKLDNIEILDEYRETIEKLDNFLKNVATRKFEIKLKYPVYDPNDLNTKIAYLKTLNNNIQASMKKMRNYVHDAYYKRGMAYLEENNQSDAQKYFLKSYEVKDDYAPALHELAKLYLRNNHLDSAFYFTNKLVYESNADQNLTNKTITIAEDIFKAYSAKINMLSQEGAHYDADLLLNKTYTQCMEFKKVGCLVIFENDFNAVYNATFDYYNQQIIDASETEDFVKAEQYVDSNLIYIKSHTKYIKNPEQYSDATYKLYYTYLRKSDSLILKKKPEKAFILLTSAERLCNTNPYIACTDSLAHMVKAAVNGKYEFLIEDAKTAFENDELERAYALIEEANKFQTEHNLYESDEVKALYNQINQKFILLSIAEGKKDFAQEKYEPAIKHFEKAQNIIEIHNYDKNPELDSLLFLAIEKHSASLIKNAEALVKGNKIIDANDNVEKVNALAEKYNLESLTSGLTTIGNVIQSQECNNVLLQIDIQLLTSKKFAEQLEYLYSFQAVTKANKFSKMYTDCQIDTSSLKQKLDSLSPPAHYQNLLNQITILIEEKSYETAIDLYREASNYYTDNELKKFELEHKSLSEYMIENDNLNFVNFGIKYFVSIDEIENALKLTKVLFDKKYPANWAKNNQVILGTNLAMRDFKYHPNRDPKLFITKYIQEDKWYNSLKKSYIKQWKKLK